MKVEARIAAKEEKRNERDLKKKMFVVFGLLAFEFMQTVE